jgi:hypothetical protein
MRRDYILHYLAGQKNQIHFINGLALIICGSYLMRFFKWLYYPTIEQGKRPIPNVVQNIPSFKRKEQSIYKPSDLWTEQDDALFLKYCPNKRDRCYQMPALKFYHFQERND